MKIITTKSKVYKAKSGDTIHEIQYRLFKVPIFTERHFVEPSKEEISALEYRAMASLISEKYRQVSFSEMSANLPDLSNAEFDKFQKQLMSQLK